MDIVFATNNGHKLEEVKAMLVDAGRRDKDAIRLLSLRDIDCYADIPETADTLEGNARLKAEYVANHYGYECFADDTGLEIDALGGEPGVFSARYAGEGHDSAANRAKVLALMEGKENRKARFRTVIALIIGGVTHTFDGVVEGIITMEERGDNGFGYDSIFIPEGFDRTFAELDGSVKNTISHRGRAVRKLVDFLSSL